MSTNDAQSKRSPLWWVLAIAIILAAIEPATHLWIQHAPPEGAVPTGLRTVDSAFYLTSMRMFPSGFESPYATCKAPLGTHHIRYFTPPAYWLYGVLGAAGRLLRISDFIALGFGNGLGALCYLLTVYAFLRQVVPKQANLAYLLFAVGGGLGGVLFIATGWAGQHNAAGFDDHFRRFALYELMEGPGLWPTLHNVRLYYTVSLALCFGGLAAFVKALRIRCSRHLILSMALLFLATLFNMRYSAFAWVVAGLWLASDDGKRGAEKLRLGFLLSLPVIIGIVVTGILFKASPTMGENTRQTVRQSMWLTPFITAAFFHLILAAFEVARSTKSTSGLSRVLTWAGLGYLAAFGVLFCAYQTYYGNWLIARDGPVADVISDWALLGAVGGVVWAVARKKAASPTPDLAWVTLWLLVFLSGAVSAFWGGRYGLLAPQRLIVFLGIPLAILAASTLQRLAARSPRLMRCIAAAMIFCGLCSITAAALCFQGPLGHKPGTGPFTSGHIEIMSPADEAVLAHLTQGTVLAPEPFGDIIAQRPGCRSIYGRGMMHADQLFNAMTTRVETFFSPETPDAYRRDFMAEWCVDYVFCSDSRPVDSGMMEVLRQTPWLDEVASEGKAVLFQMR
jgi:hypothetical protein